jgi:hypothetical protein
MIFLSLYIEYLKFFHILYNGTFLMCCFNTMPKHMLYVQNFTLITSTGVWISSHSFGGIPSLTTKHLFIGIFYDIFRKNPFQSARLAQRNNFWISPISMMMTLILKTIISLDCNIMSKNRNVRYRFFCTRHFLFDALREIIRSGFRSPTARGNPGVYPWRN